MDFWGTLYIELLKGVLALVTLGAGWLVGQRIIAFWDVRKKQQELDLTTAADFHRLYGEFKEVSRLWRAYKYDGAPDKKIVFPETLRLELLRRASAAEGGVEAITVKLATERVLSAAEIRSLGLFRQAYQELREAIRNDERFDWTRRTTEYHLHNKLTSEVAHIIASKADKRQPESSGVTDSLREIADVTPNWKAVIAARKAETAAAGAP